MQTLRCWVSEGWRGRVHLRQIAVTMPRKIEMSATEMILPAGSGWKTVPTRLVGWLQSPRWPHSALGPGQSRLVLQ